MFNFFLILSVFSLFNFINVNCDRIAKRKVYYTLESKHYCFRRLNSTHQIGCQSNQYGNIGVIHIIKDSDDIDWVVEKGSTSPYIAVVYISHFSKSNLIKLKESGRVAGVILLHSFEEKLTIDSFSPETFCPNEMFSIYANNSEYSHCSKQSWNPDNIVLSLLYQDWNFPIFLITNKTNIQHIEECFEKYSKPTNGVAPPWPLCSAELFSRMNAAKDAKTCMRRNDLNYLDMETSIRFCDPLSSFNIFSPLFHFNHSNNSSIANKSLIVLSSKIDSSSMFSELAPGADSSITSLTVLMAVASTLYKLTDELEAKRKNKTNVIFALFDGESFDYIGSSRAAFDMKHEGLKPIFFETEKNLDIPKIQLNHLSAFIELSQLAPYVNASKIWIHTDPLSRCSKSVDSFIQNVTKIMKSSLNSSRIQLEEVVNKPLPPASLQSFLRHDSFLPGLVLTNHESEFTNRFYNSFLDNKFNIKYNSSQTIDQLTGVSTVVSRSLYKLITNDQTNVTTDRELIKQLLECFLINISCPLFNQVLSLNDTQELNLPMTVSIAHPSSSHYFVVYLLQKLLANFLGTKLNISFEECLKQEETEKNFVFEWMPGVSSKGVCVKSQRFSTQALSPIFLTDPPNWDLQYSTWTESVWSSPSAKIFLMPKKSREWLTFILGLLIFIISLVIVKFLDNKALTLFSKGNSNNAQLMVNEKLNC